MTFKSAKLEETTQILVGFMTKPQAVITLRHQGVLYIHLTVTSDWVCKALTGIGRSASPLKGQTQFLDALGRTTFGCDLCFGSSAPTGKQMVDDPMMELMTSRYLLLMLTIESNSDLLSQTMILITQMSVFGSLVIKQL